MTSTAIEKRMRELVKERQTFGRREEVSDDEARAELAGRSRTSSS